MTFQITRKVEGLETLLTAKEFHLFMHFNMFPELAFFEKRFCADGASERFLA
jgi:hypothetical protein